MPLISESYREQNRGLHGQRLDYGTSGKQWAKYVANLLENEHYASVLDYGCGKGTLFAALEGFEAVERREYDPAIAGKDAEPEPAELVVCTDVLEHIEPIHLNAVLRHLAAKTQRKLFFNVATNPSKKTLPDGRNAHLIVRPPEWWREKIAEHFRIVFWQDRGNMGFAFGEAAPKRETDEKARPTARRAFRPEWAAMIEQIRLHNHRYADAFARLNTFNVWEGVGDQVADMQIVMSILERCPDVDREMQSVMKFAKKAVLAMVPLTADANESYWRRLFEKYLRLGEWHIDEIEGQKRLVCVGAPMVGVMGVTAIGAVASDDRWGQLKAACERVRPRVEAAPAPHARRAIIACYGPSLAATIDALREEAEETGAAIVSVSGAHDFLLDHGIQPTYHVECDPRPHKADNIRHPVPGVQYLIGSAVHPVLLDKLLGTGDHDRTGANVRLWHIATPEHATRIIDELGESPDCLISGGGSVGLRSIPLMYNMGYRDFSIYAMDCSFSDDGEKQWAGKHAGKRHDECEVMCGQRLFRSSPILLTYATGFFEAAQSVQDVTFRLYGDGLLQSMCAMYQNIPQVSHVQADTANAA